MSSPLQHLVGGSLMRILCENPDFLSDLKLRVSFGTAGSDAITPYRTQSRLSRIPMRC